MWDIAASASASAQVLDMSGNQIGEFFNQYVKPKSDAVFLDETVKVKMILD